MVQKQIQIAPGKYHLETSDAKEISKLLELMGGQKLTQL